MSQGICNGSRRRPPLKRIGGSAEPVAVSDRTKSAMHAAFVLLASRYRYAGGPRQFRCLRVIFRPISYFQRDLTELELEDIFEAMGWSFRRSINVGPFRMNLSKSGVGYSVGTRGLRIGKDARGRKYSSASIPNTGISRRDFYPQQETTNPAPRPVPSVRANNGVSWLLHRWPLYIGGGVLLYGLIRVIF